MHKDWLFEYTPAVIGYAVLLVILALLIGVRGGETWEQYRKEHHCVPVRLVPGNPANEAADRTVYKCDNDEEITY